MLIDMHAHTSGVSHCCVLDPESIVSVAKETGLDGIVLTNHYAENYVTVEKYIDEYHITKEAGEKIGLKVFFGIEVTVNWNPRIHLLVYGVPTEFLEEHPALYAMTQEELYALVHENGGVLVQAHPYRGGTTVLDTRYLDGVEANCHPLYDATHSERLYQVAKDAGIMLTCGGDYHGDTPYRAHCGMYLPDSLTTIQEIAEYIATADTAHLEVHELHAPVSEERYYTIR